MVETGKGLTKTYNDFHDPAVSTPGIVKLRQLHAAMDAAVLAAYGWTDVETTCGFDLDYCDVEANDDAGDETKDRLERGDYWFATPEAALTFAQELGTGNESHPWRHRWRPEVRDDILARLLLLNKERAEEERRQGKTALTTHDADDEEYDE